MTTTAIKWLIYDLMRIGTPNDEIATALKERGASFEDMVAFAVEYGQ